MSKIDEINISDLKSNNDKIDNIHAKLDSVESIKQQTKPVKFDPIKKPVTTVDPKPDDKNTVQEEKEDKNHKFTKQEREGYIKKYLTNRSKNEQLKRKEKNMIKDGEYDRVGGKLKEIMMGLSIAGIILVIVLYNYLPNDAMFALLIIIGATSFLPMGTIMGWLLFDPVMRCKVLRKVSKRNYGVVEFVGQGTKLFPKIKNFDDSLIWRNNECWVLAKSRVYQRTKDGNAINKGKEIDSENIITYVDTVPVMFLDMKSMAPMRLTNEGDSNVYPVEIGSSLKAWVDNQRAKMMAVKKMEDMMMIILMAACIGAVVVSLITMARVEELSESIVGMDEKLQLLIDGTKTP